MEGLPASVLSTSLDVASSYWLRREAYMICLPEALG